ncbi:hypothetical protein [Thauera mechernichensis]
MSVSTFLSVYLVRGITNVKVSSMGVVGVVVALTVFAKGWWLDAQIADCVGPQGKHVVTGVAIFAVVRCE